MKVKLEYEAGENPLEADELLVKALTQHAQGEGHKEDFQDPAARDLMSKIVKKHEKMFDKMMREIIEEIKKDV